MHGSLLAMCVCWGAIHECTSVPMSVFGCDTWGNAGGQHVLIYIMCTEVRYMAVS